MADIEWEKQAYGMTVAEIEKMLEIQVLPVKNGKLLFAMGLLSDAQEIISGELNHDNDGWVPPQETNRARQWINIAKYIMIKEANG